MMTIQQNPPSDRVPAPRSAISEVSGAQDDLARLLAILNEAFDELLTSFSGVQSVARNVGSAPEIDRFTSRAVAALQSEDLASQLIGHTQQRLMLVRESLQIHLQAPQTALTDTVWAAGIATCANTAETGPVRQDAMTTGSIELF